MLFLLFEAFTSWFDKNVFPIYIKFETIKKSSCTLSLMSCISVYNKRWNWNTTHDFLWCHWLRVVIQKPLRLASLNEASLLIFSGKTYLKYHRVLYSLARMCYCRYCFIFNVNVVMISMNQIFLYLGTMMKLQFEFIAWLTTKIYKICRM